MLANRLLEGCPVWRHALGAALLLGALAPAAARAGCDVAGGFQEYYVLGREDQVYAMFVAVDVGETGANTRVTQNAMESVVTLTATSDGQTIYYDHWEDGYDADPAVPGPTSETYVLARGQVLSLASDDSGPGVRAAVPTSPRGTDLRYDGGDRVFSMGGPVALVHNMWPLNYAFIAGALNIYSTQVVEDAYTYVVPVGQDSYPGAAGEFAPFKYVWLQVQAFTDDTQVLIDTGAESIFLDLDRGQTYSSRGLVDDQAAPAITVLEGTRIHASQPLQAAMVTASSGTFQARFYTLLPKRLWGRDYVTPFTGPGNATRAANLYVFNPLERDITVTGYDSVTPGGTSFSVPAGAPQAYSAAVGHAVPAGSPVRLSSADLFWGVGAVDWNGTRSDWGFTLLPANLLTDAVVPSWSPGADDQALPAGPDFNVSPIYAVPLADETIICADRDGDGAADDVDTDGNGVADPGNADYDADGSPDPGCYLTHLMASPSGLRIYDPVDFNNAGTRLYGSGLFTAAFGQDPDIALGSRASELDLGYNVLPVQQRFLEPVLAAKLQVDPATFLEQGGVATLVATLSSYSFSPLDDVTLAAFLPAPLTYEPGSTSISWPGGGPLTADPVILAAPGGIQLDWGPIASLEADQELTASFQVRLAPTAPVRLYTVEVDASAAYAGTAWTASACVDLFKGWVELLKTVDRPQAGPGEQLRYAISYRRSTDPASPDALSQIAVRDVLAPELVYVAGSATFTLSSGGTGLGSYDPATRTLSFPPFDSIRSTAMNLSGIFTFEAAVEAQPLVDEACNLAEVRGVGTPPSLPAVRSARVCTRVERPRLLMAKSAPLSVPFGQRFVYSIEVRNVGSAPAADLLVRDLLPAEVTYIPASMLLEDGFTAVPLTDQADGDGGEWDGSELTLRLASLGSGATVLLSFEVRAPAQAGVRIANVGRVAAAPITPTWTNLTVTTTGRSRAQLTLTDAAGQPAARYYLTDAIGVELEDPDQNLDPALAEEIQVTLGDPATGDSETVSAFEVAADLGRFVAAALPTVPAGSGSPPGDGVLEVRALSEVVARYTDPADATDAAEGRAPVRSRATLQFTDDAASPSAVYLVGGALWLRLEDLDQDANPLAADTASVAVSDPATGDVENLTLVETAAGSGTFFGGGLPIVPATATPVAGDGVLEARGGSLAIAAYTDPADPADRAVAEASLIHRSPGRIEIADAAGTPLASLERGGLAHAWVGDDDENRDVRALDSVLATLESSTTGDREAVICGETGLASAAFLSASGVVLVPATGSPVPGDGRLEVIAGDEVIAEYTDLDDPADVALDRVPVGGVNLLRSDALLALAPPSPERGTIFAAAPADPSLVRDGANTLPEVGEGADLALPGSADDDHFYLGLVSSPLVEPEAAVLGDNGRPLVFYQLDLPGNALRMVKEAIGLRLEF